MHLRLLAVGDRQPAWVDEACRNYSGRFPAHWKFRIDTIQTVRRSKAGQSAADTEVDTLLQKLRPGESMVLLDERGKGLASRDVAKKLTQWQNDGRDVAFVIGGPDGVNDTCRQRADFVWSLSPLTLPHGLARVLFTEQLYRAWSLNTGHPYHRE
ncbi:MAG: 23S rRNA (pseudouridine(1915)-N(3))-methyltransferase RlmH [Pseudomonadota bacterium]